MADLPTTARVVIIGGGAVGASSLYHLALAGWTDCVLLERNELTAGSTWHAAGNVPTFSTSWSIMNMQRYSTELYRELGQRVDYPMNYHVTGSIRLAHSKERMQEFERARGMGQYQGMDLEILTPDEAQARYPFMETHDLKGALYDPNDGDIDPAQLTQALAKGARDLGAQIHRFTAATGVSRENGEWIVHTDKGDIRCEYVVNAAGYYAQRVGEWFVPYGGRRVPMMVMSHQYMLTDEIPELEAYSAEHGGKLPLLRDVDTSYYLRQEKHGFNLGPYERNCRAHWVQPSDPMPEDFSFQLYPDDLERLEFYIEDAMARVPLLGQAGINKVINGPIPYSPDGNPLIGPAPGVRNYWCCCGTQFGSGGGPDLTRELARWMVHGAADISMRDYDPRRFGSYATKDWQVVKAKEDYCLRHEIPFPHFNRLAGRPVKPSPLHDLLTAKGAVHEEVYGFEHPRFFARGIAQRDHYSFNRTPVDDMVAAEVQAVRNAAGIMDVTAFSKVLVEGPDAPALLDRLTANRMPQKDGSITLTHMLNRAGRIELETTIVRMAADKFYLVCAAFFEQRLLDHLAQHRRAEDVTVTALSADWAALSLNGPHARDVLGACTDADLSNAGFRWLSARQIAVAGHTVWALRMSYAGELGWELHMPNAACVDVYTALWAAGEPYGIADYGSFAMNAMRMEMGFKGAGELTNEVTLAEADVLRFARTDKEYLGRDPTLDTDLRWVCAYLEITPDGIADGHGGEAVMLDGKVVGATASVAYGPTVGKILAFAYVTPQAAVQAAVPGTALEVVIHGTARPARVLSEPAYDPQSLRPRTDAMPQAAE